MKNSPCFVDLIIPVPLNETFTYIIPKNLIAELQVGKRVLINFGRQGIQTGVIVNIKDNYDTETYSVKEVIDIIDELPIINKIQIKLLFWMSSYYMTPIGEVLKTVLPSGLRLNSDSSLQLNPEFDLNKIEVQNEKNKITGKNRITKYSHEALSIIRYLKNKKTIPYKKIYRIIEKEEKSLFKSTIVNEKKKNKYLKIIKSLLKEGVLLAIDQVKEKYTPKIERRFRLNSDYTRKNTLTKLIASLKQYPSQQRILLLFLQEYHSSELKSKNNVGLPYQSIINRYLSISSYRTLKKNNVIEEFNKIIPRTSIRYFNTKKVPELDEMQNVTKKKIDSYFKNKNATVLLYGKTGSGKTILYIHKIRELINKKKQVLLLMPEIALTSQMTKRLYNYFGKSMAVYHSKFSDNERVEIWRGILTGKIKFVLGVRSAIFLPFKNLSLIIMDESHDGSYKQHQKMPHYHTLTVCDTLSKLYPCQLLLGTGTPDITTMYRVKTKKINLATLPFRFGGGQSPRITWVDLKKMKATQSMHNAFALETIEKIKSVCQEGYQVLVYKNRRGYSTSIRCDVCQSTPQCPKCDISLTYHLYFDELQCHYCGYVEKPLGICQSCGGQRLKTIGYGTEKIVEDLELLIPNSKILRLDSDSTKNKYSYDKIINSFSNQETNILVGTQMITKGLDFSHVRLVVVVDIDYMLYNSDYRAFEKTFQTLVQVGGRAGRTDAMGEVWVQTYQPKHQVFQWVENDDIKSLYNFEIKERQIFHYPPFVKLIRLDIKNKIERQVVKNTLSIFEELAKEFGKIRTLGPVQPYLSKINLWYIRHIYIKMENNIDREKIKLVKIRTINICQKLTNITNNKDTRIIINVDP